MKTRKRTARRKIGGNSCEGLKGMAKINCLKAENARIAAELTSNPQPVKNYESMLPSKNSVYQEIQPPEKHSISQIIGNTKNVYEYELHAVLGTGAQGTVYKAEFPMFGTVAIKTITNYNLQSVIKDIELNLRANAACKSILNVFGLILPSKDYEIMQSPHGLSSVTLYPFDSSFFYLSDDDAIHIVYEYISGYSLWKLIELGLTSQQLAKIFYELVESIHCLHENGIAHRDIKPENVMIVNGSIKVIDFGVSCNSIQDCSTLAGTMRYLGPNSFSTKVNNSTMDFYYNLDIYALGMTLYVILTYPTLYLPAQSFKKWMNSSLEHTVRLPEKYSEWTAIVEGMIRRDPGQRTSLKKVLEQIQSIFSINNLNRYNTKSTITINNYQSINESNNESVLSNYS